MTEGPEIVVLPIPLTTGKGHAQIELPIVTATGSTPDAALTALQGRSSAVAADLAYSSFGSPDAWQHLTRTPSRVYFRYHLVSVRLAYGATESGPGWMAYGTLYRESLSVQE
jgi:hypothetical protein